MALWSSNYRRPDQADARAWYQNTSRQFVGPEALTAARRPSVFLGALGCMALFWIGTFLVDDRVGGLAALLLAVNPLYRMHARRAMSDVPAEAFLLLALLFGLLAWKRASLRLPAMRSWLWVFVAGGMVGLATLAKLNGVLGGLVLVGWIGLGLSSATFSTRARWFLGMSAPVAAGVAFATFVALNPFLTAHPSAPVAAEVAPVARLSFVERVKAVYDHRATVSTLAMKTFPHNALPTLSSRVAAVAVQGFGRFGPLGPRGRSDSTVRFDFAQDRGAIVWLPWVLAGLGVAGVQGWRQFRRGEPPLSWLALIYFGAVGCVVTSFVPLAWDRYFLSLQPPAALVAALAAVAGLDRWVLRRPVARGVTA